LELEVEDPWVIAEKLESIEGVKEVNVIPELKYRARKGIDK
jgi:hypothetical protein